MATAKRVRYKPIALPSEHGAWGFWLEPALLGLLIAPSWAAPALATAALFALLLQQPLSISLADLRRQAVFPRTRVAWGFCALYGALAATAVVAAIAAANTFAILLPALFAAPLALLQLSYDVRNRGRELLPELAGATAMGALAACIALAAGWPVPAALSLWLALAARSVPSILYVRSRLRLERGQKVSWLPSILAHAAALAAVSILVWVGLLPVLVVAAFLVLQARAAVGLSRHRRPAPATLIGIREIGFGFLVVAAIVVGFALGL